MVFGGGPGKETSSGNHHHELLSKGMRAGPKLPGLHPGGVNSSVSRKAAQKRVFVIKNRSATYSRVDLPGE